MCSSCSCSGFPHCGPGWGGFVTALIAATTCYRISDTEVGTTVSTMAPTVAMVAFILLGGVGLAETMNLSGAQERISAWLEQVESGADRTTTLLLVYGMTPLMESVTGFGLGVVITAPLLIRHGLAPIKAVMVGLLGLVLVPWGSLAPGTLIAADLGGQNFNDLGVWSAIFTLPVLVVSMTAVLALTIGRPNVRQLGLAGVVILTQETTLVAANLALGPPLAGVIAGTAVIAVLLIRTWSVNGPLPRVSPELAVAMVPYLVLGCGILLATAGLELADTSEQPSWVSSPALWVNMAVLAGLSILRAPHRRKLTAIGTIVRKWVPVAGNTLIFMLLGIVMAATGMAQHLADTAAHSGLGFVAAIPAIGALGGYLTGSNTGAAAMFSAGTASAATSLGANPLIALAGQNVAGSIAIIASPPRIALATVVALEPGEQLPRTAKQALYFVVSVVALVLGAIVLSLAT
nr:L-lactate permease [Mycobacterium ulcerans]